MLIHCECVENADMIPVIHNQLAIYDHPLISHGRTAEHDHDLS